MPVTNFPINLQDKIFRSLSNTGNGEVDAATHFHYRQSGEIIWATYSGGQIRFGTLSGFMDQTGALTFCYQHQNEEGNFMTGKCHSLPEWTSENKLRYREYWQWTSGDGSSGESIIEQVD
ncbi:MAG: hypothetical protein R2828_31185 [Saprospiraceae bacterium]